MAVGNDVLSMRYVDEILRVIAQPFGSGQGVEERLRINGRQAHLERLVEKGIAGLGQNQVGHIVDVPVREMLDELNLAISHEIATKIVDRSVLNAGG